MPTSYITLPVCALEVACSFSATSPTELIQFSRVQCTASGRYSSSCIWGIHGAGDVLLGGTQPRSLAADGHQVCGLSAVARGDNGGACQRPLGLPLSHQRTLWLACTALTSTRYPVGRAGDSLRLGRAGRRCRGGVRAAGLQLPVMPRHRRRLLQFCLVERGDELHHAERCGLARPSLSPQQCRAVAPAQLRTARCATPYACPQRCLRVTRAAVNKKAVEVVKDDFITSKQKGPDAGR